MTMPLVPTFQYQQLSYMPAATMLNPEQYPPTGFLFCLCLVSIL